MLTAEPGAGKSHFVAFLSRTGAEPLKDTCKKPALSWAAAQPRRQQKKLFYFINFAENVWELLPNEY